MKTFYGENKSPFQILILLFSVCFLGGFLGNIIIFLLLNIQHLQINSLLNNLNENSSLEDKKRLVNILAINHLTTFLLPALILLSMLYAHTWTRVVKLTTPKNIVLLILGLLWLLFSYPLIEWLYSVNKAIPMPDWMIGMEESTNQLVVNLLSSQDIGLLFLNILVMAVLPALGEELVFRGIVQPNFIKLFKNYHIAIWISALIFSAIHMQFQGFIPRFVLGAMLGYLSFWTNNLWYPIIAHFVNNSIQVLVIYFVKKNSIDIDLNNNLEFPIYIIIISVFLFFGIGWYFYNNFIRNTKNETE